MAFRFIWQLIISGPMEIASALVGIRPYLGYIWPLSTIIGALLINRFVVQFIGQIAALVWLRRSQPDLERPFRMWLYPLPCVMALAGWVFLIATSNKSSQVCGLFVLVVGVVACFAWQAFVRRSRQ